MNYPKPFRREGQTSLWFNYVDPITGKRKLKSTGSSKVGESKEFIQNFMDRLTPGGRTTFRIYAEKFFSPDTNPRYIRCHMTGLRYGKGQCVQYKYLFPKYVFTDGFSNKVLSEINRGDVLDFYSRLMGRYSEHPATVNKIIALVSAVFSEAYFRGDIRYNPAQELKDIEYEQKKRGTFSPEEIRDMFSDPSRWPSREVYNVFLFAAYTGRRAGEIIGLQWSQIHDGYCEIDRAYNQVEKDITDPKWGRCVTIPLCKTLYDRLPPKTSQYVFTTERGSHIYMSWWKKRFREAMIKLGIDKEGRNLVAHSFRHSLNTNLILAMLPELYVKKYIGWSDTNQDTQAIYTHIKPEHLKFVADKIDDIYKIEEPGSLRV